LDQGGHIVIADENPVLVASLAALLASELEMDADRLVQVAPIMQPRIVDAAPDVLILDPILTDGLPELVDRVTETVPDVSLVAYASRPTLELARYCVEIGFKGFIPKTMAPMSLVSAIRVILTGGTFIHKTFVRQMRAAELAETAGRALSEREETTLRMVALGYSNREIAAHLELSTKTVDTHRTRAMKKLAIEAKPELVRVACARGWLY
jgi:DNA-binding NarL/FixJ family response regulator